MIFYEYPFTERIRLLLRLEGLFTKVTHFAGQDGVLEHHVALGGLFEILDLVGRIDPKMDLLQELERQRQTLLGFRNNPQVSEQALDGSLYEIEQASANLLASNGRFGQALRDNEWLMMIKHKSSIPGGACGFDLPSYHCWLNLPSATRREQLAQWQKTIIPVREAIIIILRLLRSSGSVENVLAARGQYQQMLGGMFFQMVRITLSEDDWAVPEISANRHVLNIRFAQPSSAEAKNKYCDQDVRFELGFCSLH
ncbi:MAG: cell division protein ZapD [Zoogloeaceae bacterium]|nr:cell division protein ZapD [Zoogloeaceae bacterium]